MGLRIVETTGTSLGGASDGPKCPSLQDTPENPIALK